MVGESGDRLFVSRDERARDVQPKNKTPGRLQRGVKNTHNYGKLENSPCTQNAAAVMTPTLPVLLLKPPSLKIGTRGTSLDESIHKITCAKLCTQTRAHKEKP